MNEAASSGMVRSELVRRLAEQNPHLYLKDVEAVVDTILDTMTAALANGDRVELRGFGVFETKRQKARAGRNPRSGAAVQIPAKTSIQFKTGRLMQARLNRAKVEPEEEVGQLLRAS